MPYVKIVDVGDQSDTPIYRIYEIVVNGGDFITWPGLFSNKHRAILEIESVLKLKLSDEQYKNIQYHGVDL